MLAVEYVRNLIGVRCRDDIGDWSTVYLAIFCIPLKTLELTKQSLRFPNTPNGLYNIDITPSGLYFALFERNFSYFVHTEYEPT